MQMLVHLGSRLSVLPFAMGLFQQLAVQQQGPRSHVLIYQLQPLLTDCGLLLLRWCSPYTQPAA